MWTAIILIFVLLAAVIVSGIEKDKHISVFLLLLFVGVIITSLILASSVPLVTTKTTNQINIVALSNGTQIQGESFLFAGEINQEPVYYYFQTTSNGGFVQNDISANNVTIYQDTINTGYILTINISRIAKPSYFKKYKNWIWMFRTYGIPITTTEIHVPPNTIVQQFNLNLENNK
jgi:hypothetical protein